MQPASLADRVVFLLVNAGIYLRHPRYAHSCRRRLGYWPNFATPRWLGELTQWRKLFDRNPIYVTLTDKLAVKEWAARHFPELAVPRTLWAGDRPEDIPDELIRPDVVIKTNNASDQNYFPGRQGLDRRAINALFNGWLSDPAVRRKRVGSMQEWAYGLIEPKILVESLIGEGKPVADIFVRSFNGTAMAVLIATDFKTDASRLGYYYPDGTRMPVPAGGVYNALPDGHPTPKTFAAAADFARHISSGFDYLRVDFLTDGDRLYLGEITVYPSSGYIPRDWAMEATYRQWLTTIELCWFFSTPQPWPLSIYAAALKRWLAVRRQAPPTIPVPAPVAEAAPRQAVQAG